jgi:hypothetical protein
MLTATLPNGSVIWVTGADTDESEMNKLLGRKYKLVILDEASMFSVNMHQLVYGVLKPATADQRGTICLLGTSSNITRGLFYDITTGKEAGWSLHQWTAHDNPHVATQWQEELEDIAKNRPLFMETALFKQWYLNKWTISEDALVYKYKEGINDAHYLPNLVSPYRYVLGIDLGHSPDPSAFVVGAYNEESPTIYIVHAEQHLKMDITAVSEKIAELDLKYSFDARIIDGSMKMAIEEMNTRHGMRVIPADKGGKEHWINLFNSEFVQGRVKLLPAAKDLRDEYNALVWCTDNGLIKIPRKEHPNLANHCADAALYMLRYTHSYLYQPKTRDPDPFSQAVWEKAHMERLVAEAKREANPHSLELEYDQDLFSFELDDGI